MIDFFPWENKYQNKGSVLFYCGTKMGQKQYQTSIVKLHMKTDLGLERWLSS